MVDRMGIHHRGTRSSAAALAALLLVLFTPPPVSAASAARAAGLTSHPGSGVTAVRTVHTVMGRAAGKAAASGSLGPVVLPVPSPPEVLTPFRPPADRWGAGHRGIDLAAAPGQPIRAAAAGVVAFAGEVAGRPVVSVAHTPVLRTTYEPVLPTVSAGTTVTAGQVIGVLQGGHSSCSPATCLHWGARMGADRYLDPLSLLTGIRVRLKPWG